MADYSKIGVYVRIGSQSAGFILPNDREAYKVFMKSAATDTVLSTDARQEKQREKRMGGNIMEQKKVVAYCRVASADDTSMKMQTDTVMAFAEAEGYAVSECYCDNGESGRTLNRPEMERLLADIRNGKISIIVAKDYSRIARDFMLTMEFTDIAKKHGVTIVTMYEGASIPMMENFANHLLRSSSVVTA